MTEISSIPPATTGVLTPPKLDPVLVSNAQPSGKPEAKFQPLHSNVPSAHWIVWIMPFTVSHWHIELVEPMSTHC
jgi:hypothetical protein